MDMNRAMNTRSRSKVIYYSAFAVAVAFILASQFMLSVLIPASGVTPDPSLITVGSTLTFLGVVSTLVMVYAMLLRNKGQ